MSGPRIGLTEWFRPGDYARVDAVITQAKVLNITELRTGICWADWYTSEGDGWYAWLLPTLSQEFKLLPCFLYTPPSLGIAPKFSSPPRSPKAYADFIDVMITRFGHLFDWIELWNHPTNINDWDTRLDPGWSIFSEMVGGAAYWIRERGKKVVLPGLWPTDLHWFELMADRGVLAYVDAVGVHGFPSSPEFGWRSWRKEVADVRKCLQRLNVNPEIWITQTGFSTWRGDERSQEIAFFEALDAPVERVYWSELFDRSPKTTFADAAHSDERDFHYGLLRADGSPKLLYQRWSENGLNSLLASSRSSSKISPSSSRKRAVITGGAGFIGTNLAERLVHEGFKVTLFDNLSRFGVDKNIEWLTSTYPEDTTLDEGDIRNADHVRKALRKADQVFHLAAQVAVTTSLVNPREDHEINVGGTINVLEALRENASPPALIFTSTNKVYGGLTDLTLERNCTRYRPLDASLRTGISEQRPLDFHSPYGCSKGAADQYVLDYARSFGIPAVVFRMSCIYGPHQMGTEDQGWIAHFLIKAISGEPIVICGDGMQVRDVLFIEDLVDAFLLAQANSRTLSGQAFNIGGGLGNTISLLELLQLIETMEGRKPNIQMEDWRVGDQRYYVSDTAKFKAATGWAPRVSVREGIGRLYKWLKEFSTERIPVAATEGEHALLSR
ncbi:MAG TPA: NAD-dependent epimerase/dehydratase family protein [Bryobacteraceae bacterium]|nr:NAD-dependent epimerase/dehydratase family protein [Bryobacteraceae bacterium]